MLRQVLVGVAVIGTVSGVALAQTYISMSPPAAAFAPPSVIAPRTSITTAPRPARDKGEVTVQKVVDSKGNAAGAAKDLLAGSP